MGRAGRYTLSVMAWVAAFAGWSTLIGLVVAAVTGDQAQAGVSAGTSALFYVLGPLVPTLVALWFNDWARDGFPTREQVKERQRAAAEAGARRADDEPRADEPRADEVSGGAPREDVGREEGWPTVAATPAAAAPAPAPVAAVMPDGAAPAFVTATPLGVPEAPAGAAGEPGGFPVAPLLRDRLDLDGR